MSDKLTGRPNIIGSMAPNQIFGRLTTVEPTKDRARWLCRCECGNPTIVSIYSLHEGSSQSCGCLARERASEANTKHGAGKNYHVERLYRIWQHMRGRCQNPNDDWFKNYGARGISVCNEWNDSYAVFREWALSNSYEDGLTIERKDYDGNYHPDNCCWIPKAQQSANTRRTLFITAFGETKMLRAWMRDSRCSVHYVTIRDRLKKGWPPELAISEPNTKHIIEESDYHDE